MQAWKVEYFEKYQDPRWQKKRLEIFQRDEFKCLACGTSTRTLTVNHLKYGKEPWDIDDDALETLCKACHDWRTDFDELIKYFHGKRTRIPTLIHQRFEEMINFAGVNLNDGGEEVLREVYEKLLAFEASKRPKP